MNNALYSIPNTGALAKDSVVEEFMNAMMAKYPQIHGYVYERLDTCVQILLWGDIEGP